MKKTVVIIIWALFFVQLFADIHYSYYVKNEFKPYLKIVEKNQPIIPFQTINLLIPFGETIEDIKVEIENHNSTQKMDFEICKDIKPISDSSSPQPIKESLIKPIFPEVSYKVLPLQYYKGYQILPINIYPYQFKYFEKTSIENTHYEIDIKTAFSSKQRKSLNKRLIANKITQAEIAKLVVNPEAISSYQKDYVYSYKNLPSSSDPAKMIIITSEDRIDYFSDFIARKESHNISCNIFSTEDIYNEYDGIDNKEKIRNFIIDAYELYSNSETDFLQYVILGGDDEVVPYRGMYGRVGSTVDYGIPSDIYFSALDGDWNANGNDIYGEPDDDPDYYPEIAIGRIPAQTQEEFNDFFYKTEYYEENNTYSNDIAFMYGENLNNNPVTWGGDYKDEISPYLPDGFHINTLYERDNTFNTINVVNSFNEGLGIINHMGHANYNYLFGTGMGLIDLLENEEYGFAYSQGCYPAAFDNGATNGSECIAEMLIRKPHGLFAFVGNTRYGWYSPGDTNGASQFFDHTFFQGLFEENIRELGRTLNYSKTELASSAMESSVMRWVYYEMLVFGDPSVAIKDANGQYPFLKPTNFTFDDVNGDNDGNINPGEEILIYPTIKNFEGWANAENISILFDINNQYINVITDSIFINSIASGEEFISTDPFIIQIAEDLPLKDYNFDVTISCPVGEGEFQKTFSSHLSINLNQNNWPWLNQQNVKTGPIFIDFDNDENNEILSIDSAGNYNLLNNSAEILSSENITDDNIFKEFAYADIDDDGKIEIVGASLAGNIFAYNSDGLLFNYHTETQISTPIISDITGDGLPEIISFGNDFNVIALDNQGNLLQGFPVEIGSLSIYELSSSDLNGDDINDILFVTNNGSLYIIEGNGTILDGYPIELGNIASSPVIGPDKKIYIGNLNNELLIINPLTNDITHIEINGKIEDSPSILGLSYDGTYKIAFVTNQNLLYLVNENGEVLENFPQNLNERIAMQPIIADINNDEILDILLFSSNNNIYLFNEYGTEYGISPIEVGLSSAKLGTIADIDGDNDFEIITGFYQGVNVVDLKFEKGTKLPWIYYRGNLQRTGSLLNPGQLDADDAVSLSINSVRSYPNPFLLNNNKKNSSIKISFNMTKKGKVNVDIFNIKGQHIANIISEEKEAGNVVCTWNGLDNANQRVSSGVYFYKITTRNISKMNKMVIVK